MKKRLIASLLSLTLVTGLLAGCGSGENSGNTGNEGADEGQEVSETTDASKTEGTSGQEAEQGEGNGEVVTLRVTLKGVSMEDERQRVWFDAYNAALAEAGIPAKLEVVEMQSGSYQDNLSLMLNSGDIPDIIYFQGGDQVFAAQGILEDLTPYIENSQYVKDALEDFQKERLANYPYLLFVTPALTPTPVIRTDVLDGCASAEEVLADPTIENYLKLFEELKEGRKAVFGLDGNLKGINAMFDQAFGLTSTWVKDESGNYVYGRVSDQSLEELKFYASLYQKGIIDKDYLSANWEVKENDFYSNNTAIISGNQGAVIDLYNSNQVAANGEGAALTVLPPAKGEAQGYLPLDVSKESRGFAISALSEHKDLAFEVLDFAVSGPGRILDLMGTEGKDYTVENGVYTLLPDHDTWYANFFETFENFDLGAMNPDTPYWSDAAVSSAEMMATYATMDNAFVIPEEHIVNWDAAETKLAEFTADFVIGNKTEADWEAFVEEWNSVGGAAVTEYANTVLK